MNTSTTIKRTPMIANTSLITDLQKVHAQYGSISASLYQDAGSYSVGTVVKHFDGWNNAVIAAGLPLSVMGRRQGTYVIPSRDLIADMDHTMTKVAPLPLTQRRYDQEGSYSFGTVCRRFPSWGDALSRVQMRRDILADIVGLAQNNILDERTYASAGSFTPEQVNEICGSLSEAMEDAKITDLDVVIAGVVAAKESVIDTPDADSRQAALLARVTGERTLAAAEGTSLRGVSHLESALAELREVMGTK